jgi:hypothetical protein
MLQAPGGPEEAQMKTSLLIAAIAVVTAASVASADRGSIPFKQGVEIFEPNQRAMLAWNGEEEILLLSTDLWASESTMVLEVLPLPSEPEVKEGDVEVFAKATEMINRKVAAEGGNTRGGKLAPGMEKREPAGEVTFHEKIGSHDISVAHVLNQMGFIAWVAEYLDSVGVKDATIPEPLKEVVEEYIEEGFTWFVFDVVSLDEEPKTSEAIQYRFKTDQLYYPLRITRTETGFTNVDLLVLTPRLLSVFPGYPHDRISLPHQPVTIAGIELWGLSKDMHDLLGKPKEAKLRVWRIAGDLDSFEKDLLAK